MNNTSDRDARPRSPEIMRPGTVLPKWTRRLGYYGLALLLVAAAALLREALMRRVGPGLPPYLTFYPVVMLAALIGGWGPGVLATLATMAVVDYWLLPPPGLFKIENMVDAIGLVFFCAMGVFMSIGGELYRRARGRMEALLILRTAAWCQANEQLRQQTLELHTQAEELRAQEAELESILTRTPFMLIRCSRDLHYRYVSRAYAEMIGSTPDQIAGQPMAKIMGEEGFETIRPHIEAVLQGQPVAYEAPVHFRGVGTRFLRVAYVPDRDEQGRVVGWIASILDLTERVQAEESLRRSEEQFHRLFEDDLTGNYISSPEGQILLCNPAFAEIFGFSRAIDAVGTNIGDLYLDLREREPLVEKLKTQGKIDRLEVWRKRRDGQRIHVVENLVGHFNDAGQLREIQGYIFEDTSRQHAEEALSASEQRYRKLFEASLAGVYITKLDGTILDFNDAMMQMLGYDSRAELLQHRSSDFYADPEFRDELIRLLRKEGVVPGKEAVLRRKDGSVLHALGAAVLLADEHTGELYIQGVAIDITERKRAEEALREWNATLEIKVAERTDELRRRARQLQKLTLDMSETEDRERTRMAEILHDDLQQQIAGAKFHVGLMRNRARGDPSVQELGAKIDHMLKDAIEKSRSLSHELSPTVLHHTDFAETLRWLAREIQAKHGLAVHVRAPAAVRTQSDALRGFLYKAAQELLFNIVKHAGVKEAFVRVRPCGGYICLVVSDRGRGFDPQGLRETAGYGLLSIRERIELLGGRMKIKSARGKGSTFLIVVPNGGLAGTGSGTRTKPNGRAKAADEDQGRLRVLLADDHEIVREGLRSLLSDEHDVQIVGEAANGREAVDLASRLKPDVIIMDMSMPVIEGDEATRQIKAYLPQTRVIAISMYDQAEKADAMYRAGAESYILKTAPSEELLAAIRGQGHAEAQ